MISEISIKAYKSIKSIKFECSYLNLFVGTNSSGKSSCLQALLLYEQNKEYNFGLNGDLISVGEFREVRNNSLREIPIELSINSRIKGEKSITEYMTFTEDYDTNECVVNKHIEEESSTVFYLSCNRLGVRDLFHKSTKIKNALGNDGEYAIPYLWKHKDDLLEESMCHSFEVGNTLQAQVNYWLMRIINTNLEVMGIDKTDYVQVIYNNNPQNKNSAALYRRPTNIGAGVSYLVSIIVLCLASTDTSVIVLENPEIHLHPKAQSKLCEFFYFISKANRQLFIETHSDHIFNAIRVGISADNWNPKLIKVNFLAMNDKYETQCNPITFGPYGRIIGNNPEMDIDDLFDQFEIDLDRMLGL